MEEIRKIRSELTIVSKECEIAREKFRELRKLKLELERKIKEKEGVVFVIETGMYNLIDQYITEYVTVHCKNKNDNRFVRLRNFVNGSEAVMFITVVDRNDSTRRITRGIEVVNIVNDVYVIGM